MYPRGHCTEFDASKTRGSKVQETNCFRCKAMEGEAEKERKVKTRREMFHGIIAALEKVEKDDVVEWRKHGNVFYGIRKCRRIDNCERNAWKDSMRRD